MDPSIWRKLPDALVDRVVASLPLPSLCRCRALSRRFNANLFQQSFLDMRENIQRHAPHFLIIVDGALVLTYSLAFEKWYSIPFPTLNALSQFDIVAATGGLLCVKTRDNGLLVCNPLTTSVRELPPVPIIGTTFEAGMVMDKNGKDYKIIAWKDEHPSPITEVYTSENNGWALKSSIQIRGDVLSDSGGVICGDYFYILVIYEYLSVFAYEIEGDSWHELEAPLPVDILYGYLINHRGSLMLVGGTGKNFPTKGISMWKLNVARTSWISILSMPTELFDALTKNFERYDAFNCAGQGDHICFIADHHSRALTYDLARGAWHWSPHFRTGAKHQIVGVELRLSAAA